MISFLCILTLLCQFGFHNGLLLSELRTLFGDKYCIVGSSLALKNIQSPEVLENNEQSPVEIDDMFSVQHDNGKSVMSAIHELAQYNDINYSYELINEEGPPHSKIFSITLYLGNEQYQAEGRRLKIAQREAAILALKNTEYEHPPLKIKDKENVPTPISLLNNLASKLGLAVKYTVVTNDILELEKHSDSIDIRSKKSYLQKLNDTVYSNDTVHIRKDVSDSKGPFKVQLNVNDMKFLGEAYTVQNAKHEAAIKALTYIKNHEDSFSCEKIGNDCKQRKQSIKSPISLVYEAAQKRNIPVEFELIDEFGPSHKKVFKTKCTVGNLEATGSGKSKKESKRIAAENILPSLMNVPEVQGNHHNLPNKKQKNKKKGNKVVKSTFDKIDRMLDNVIDFGKSFIDKVKGTEDESKPNKKKGDKQTRSASDEILILGNILKLEVQYTDFTENGKSFALLDLGTKPAFICLGEGVSKKNSRDLAAKHGVKVFFKLGLLNNLLDKSIDISQVLDKEESYQYLLLETIDAEEEKHSEL